MSIEESSIPGLLALLKAKHPFTRLFWASLYIFASAVLAWHMYLLSMRYCDSDVSSQIRTFTNETVKFPTIYLWLYNPKRVDFPMKHPIVHEFEQQRVYELSDWSKFEAINQTMVQLPFCAAEITGAQGYLGVIYAVNVETNTKGVLNPLITTTKPLLTGGRSTLSIELKQVSVLPPPYSACADEYPSEFNLTATRRNSPYSQGDCYLYCRASWLMATFCSCSLRVWTGLDTPASRNLSSCPVYGDNATADDLSNDDLMDICRFEPKYWFLLPQVIEPLQSVQASTQCNMCADQCSYTEYVSSLDTLPASEVNDCPPSDDRYVDVYKSTVIIDLKKRITTSKEELDYPAVEFYSEMLGIFGAYLGFSLCTFAEFFHLLFIGMFYRLRKSMRGASLINEKNSVSLLVSIVNTFFVEADTVNAVTETGCAGTPVGIKYLHNNNKSNIDLPCGIEHSTSMLGPKYPKHKS